MVKELQSLCLNVELIGEKLASENDPIGEIAQLATTDVLEEEKVVELVADKSKKKKGKK